MVLAVAIEMLDRYSSIHAVGIVHNGVKPQNICIAPSLDESNGSTIYIIDFGFSSFFDVNEPRLSTTCGSGTGNRLFVSALSHIGVTQSQRCDLESLAYLLAYLYHGSLPWTSSDSQRAKMSTPAATIFRDMDAAFLHFWKDIRSLAFGEKPNYSAMKTRFEDVWRRRAYENQPGKLNWIELLEKLKTDQRRVATTTSSTSRLVPIFDPSKSIVAAFDEIHGWNRLDIILQIPHKSSEPAPSPLGFVFFFLVYLFFWQTLSFHCLWFVVCNWYFQPSWIAQELNGCADLVLNYWTRRIERMKSTASGVEPHNFLRTT